MSENTNMPEKKSLQDLRIIFMGTPAFATASLDALVQVGCNIVAVITAPDKPAGRGMKPQESAVKKYAVEKGLHILQPEKLKNPDFINELENLHADIQVVVAFRMLPEIVWNMPPIGTINVHASLLPQYRGAAPINWAIINGEKETGITTFKLQHEIDTGNILMQERLLISENENAGELHDRLMKTGAGLLVKTLEGLAQQSLQEIPQTSFSLSGVKHAPKIFTETCKINWDAEANTVYNLIRGLSPYPAAFTFINDKQVKIYKCSKEINEHNKLPGEFITDGKTFLKFACNNGFIHVLELQMEGRKKMFIEDFLRGYRFQ